MTLRAEDLGRFLLASTTDAHERDLDVGGLFNAYEPAVHFALFTAALRRGLWDTTQEEPLGSGQKSCDLVLPLHDGRRAWVEVKMWWWLSEAYDQPYWMLSKSAGGPASDWKRLEPKVRQGDARAVLLLRCWDDVHGKAVADDWLRNEALLVGRPSTDAAVLDQVQYEGRRRHTRRGDVTLWLEVDGH